MSSAAEPSQFGSPPRYGHSIIPINRLGLTGHVKLTKVSMGAIDVVDAAAADTIAGIFSDTYPTEDLLGGETVTYATSDTVFAQLISRKINEYVHEHHYWSFPAVDHVFIIPQNPWASDAGVITADDTGFTAAIADLNVEQAFAAGIRVPSGLTNIAGTAVYAIGLDMQNMPSNTATIIGDDEIEGKEATPLNAQSIKGYQINMTSDQNANVFQGYEGQDLIVADSTYVRRTDIELFQWREMPVFIQFAAAATWFYQLRGF